VKIKIKIKRCEPMGREVCSPFLQAYDVEATEGMSVLEALAAIDDPTLSYRRSCRSAICGSCAITINGFPKLACKTQLLAEVEKKGEVVLEPLESFRVIKDLVVDFVPFWEKLVKVEPYLTPPECESVASKEGCTHGEEASQAISQEAEEVIDSSQKCILCGSCNAACNTHEVDKNFIGPAASAKAWRFVGDVREGEKRRRLKRLSSEHGIWECVRCYHCTEYCPKDVKPLEAIERLRSKAMDEGLNDGYGPKHVEALVASVKRVGRLDEAAMTFKTLGFLRSLGMIPFGIKMEMHGKMPHPMLFPAIENIDEVRKIYEAREAQRAKLMAKQQGSVAQGKQDDD
jgi:succinate dehydrogenase / fumarate reductase iron-sulfur subunit